MERESRTVEYKREVSDLGAIARTVAAFANGDGGRIIIGVDDTTRSVIGLDATQIDALLEKLPVSIADSIEPALYPQIFARSINDKEVLIVQVFPGSQKPYFIASEGIDRGVYIRVGAHTRRASGGVLEELRLLRSHAGYDEAMMTECSLEELKLSLLPANLRTHKALVSLDVVKHDRFSGVLHPTRGGVLMLHPEPHRHVNEAYVVASRMRGRAGRDTVETHEITGDLGGQFEQLLALLEDWLAVEPRIEGAKYRPHPRIPIVAVREALSNALFHRQYSIPGPIKVAHFADRLEVFSPGHFAGPFIPDSLGDGTSYIRNRVLALLARRLHYIEKRGTGIRVIIESLREAGLEEPEFIEGPLWFKVVLPFNKRTESSASGAEEAILEMLETNVSITSSDVRQRLRVSKATAVALLERLIKEGRIVRKGKGPATHYTVSGS